MKIWLMNHHAGNMFFDKGGRHYNFAKYLKRLGHEPVVFCSNSKHGKAEKFWNTGALWEEHIAEEIDVPFIFVKSRTYEGNGKQRVLNMIDFYRNVKKAAKEYAKKGSKPDVILASSVHPLTIVAGIKLAKHYKVKCIGEVRDLWPESIVDFTDRFKKNNPIIRALYLGEKWIYTKCDRLIFTMEGGKDYIIEHGWDKEHGGPVDVNKIYHINNGVDLEIFNFNKETYQIDDEDLKNPNIFKVIYTGSIRRVNNLGLVLDVAKNVSNPKVKFLVWGDGDELEKLQKRVEEEKITNVVFKGRVGKEFVPYIVSLADVNYAHNFPSLLFKYGISFNKLFDYFAAGKPILTDFECKYNPVLQKEAGWNADNCSSESIADAVNNIVNGNVGTYEQFCDNAVKASEDYDFKVLTGKLCAVIDTCIQ